MVVLMALLVAAAFAAVAVFARHGVAKPRVQGPTSQPSGST
jgi:hypothetical protein